MHKSSVFVSFLNFKRIDHYTKLDQKQKQKKKEETVMEVINETLRK